MSLFSPIHHTFAPLGDAEQRRLAVSRSYLLWQLKRGKHTELLSNAISQRFGGKTFLFASGREGLVATFESIPHEKGDHVIVQGYTCVVVVNAIYAAGFVPVFCDIERDTLNLNIDALKKTITPTTRAIICQHTFGIPADTKMLRDICNDKKILLIEDCAHVIPDETGPSEIGAEGDFLLLSFGRDKAISGITGGAVVCRHQSSIASLEKQELSAQDLSTWTILRLLEYPQIYAVARPLYGIGIGKIFLKLMSMLGMLVPILSSDEKKGHMQKSPLHRMPNICATLAYHQWKRLSELNDHRRMLTRFYMEEFTRRSWKILDGITPDLPLQKFPLFTKNAEKIRRSLKMKNIHLHDGWTGCVVCPASVDLPATGYELGKDPEAEAVCEEILSLPTHPGMTLVQAKRLMEELAPLLVSSQNT